MHENFVFSSESVTEGHPDKVADQISDAILDNIIACDTKARVACETLVTTGLAVVAGEITTECYVDIPKLVRETIENIGYTDARMGFDCNTCAVVSTIDKQSSDIAMGVDKKDPKLQGAGDQGMMFGYACDDTRDLMPLPIFLAHALTKRLAVVRKKNILDFLRPDGKSQVTVQFEKNKPVHIPAVVISTQHNAHVSHKNLRAAIIDEVIMKAIPKAYLKLIDKKTKFHINPTGNFIIGGPQGDCGLTGRKIIVDTYGGWGHNGGGAFSGKDPSKVDRSASYMARYIAKNLVKAKLAKRCEVQLAYAIGVREPVSVSINTFGTGKVDEAKLVKLVRRHFDLTPYGITTSLDLLKPVYLKTASYGHFGENTRKMTWEQTDKAQMLAEDAQ